MFTKHLCHFKLTLQLYPSNVDLSLHHFEKFANLLSTRSITCLLDLDWKLKSQCSSLSNWLVISYYSLWRVYTNIRICTNRCVFQQIAFSSVPQENLQRWNHKLAGIHDIYSPVLYIGVRYIFTLKLWGNPEFPRITVL